MFRPQSLLVTTLLVLAAGAARSAETPTPTPDPLADAKRAVEAARLRLRLFERVDYPLRLQELDGRLQLTRAEIESLRRRIAEYERSTDPGGVSNLGRDSPATTGCRTALEAARPGAVAVAASLQGRAPATAVIDRTSRTRVFEGSTLDSSFELKRGVASRDGPCTSFPGSACPLR